MAAHEPDPRHLDVAAFARSGGELGGSWPVRGFERLQASAVLEALPAGAAVAWSAHGEHHAPAGRPAEVWLHLVAETTLPLECQRCLAPVETPLRVDRRFLFVAGEEAAAELDGEREEDVLALTRSLDLHALVEDELLLGLPLVPRHDVCPVALPYRPDVDEEGEPAPHPFEALAALKRERPLN